jgi:hypothetical protein
MRVSYDIIVPGYFPNFPIKFVSGRPKLSVVAPIMGTRAMTESLHDRKFHLSVLHYRPQDLGTVPRESKRPGVYRMYDLVAVIEGEILRGVLFKIEEELGA